MKKRCSGILMPVSSLPGGYGIGSMGQAARDFVDFLALAGQSVWQILPVGPTSYGDSPYQSCSAFAGNPYFIDLDQLAADGLLKPEDYAKENWGTNPNYCDYALLYQKRYKVLRKAYAAFLQQRPVPGYDTPYSDDWYRFYLFERCLAAGLLPVHGNQRRKQDVRLADLACPAALARPQGTGRVPHRPC